MPNPFLIRFGVGIAICGVISVTIAMRKQKALQPPIRVSDSGSEPTNALNAIPPDSLLRCVNAVLLLPDVEVRMLFLTTAWSTKLSTDQQLHQFMGLLAYMEINEGEEINDTQSTNYNGGDDDGTEESRESRRMRQPQQDARFLLVFLLKEIEGESCQVDALLRALTVCPPQHRRTLLRRLYRIWSFNLWSDILYHLVQRCRCCPSLCHVAAAADTMVAPTDDMADDMADGDLRQLVNVLINQEAGIAAQEFDTADSAVSSATASNHGLTIETSSHQGQGDAQEQDEETIRTFVELLWRLDNDNHAQQQLEPGLVATTTAPITGLLRGLLLCHDSRCP